MKVRVVVADEAEASFFETDGINVPLRLLEKIEDTASRAQDRELETDKPGRGFGVGAERHAVDGERSSQRQNQMRFADRIAQKIERARQQGEFDRLVILAGPRMLGLIRDALPDTARQSVAAEISKDLVHLDAEVLRTYVPRQVFRPADFPPGQ